MSKSTKSYQGIVRDRMSDRVNKTRVYNNYYAAHAAAEKLCKKYYTGERGSIDVETITQYDNGITTRN